MVERFNGRIRSEVLDINVYSHRALEQPLCGFNTAYNARRQRVLNGRTPNHVTAEHFAAKPELANPAPYGRAGPCYATKARLIADAAKEVSQPDRDAAMQALRDRGAEVLFGNAADPAILTSANVAQARLLLVAIPDAFEAGQIVQQARVANSTIEIIARAHFDAEVTHLSQLGATTVVMGEREIARTMLERTLASGAQSAGASAVPALVTVTG